MDPSNPADPEDPVIPPEVPSLGLHPTISGGSTCLELKTSETKGRYIVTNQGKLCQVIIWFFGVYTFLYRVWTFEPHCCICCNPVKGRVDFEDGWLVKSSFITKDEMKACQLTRTKLPHTKKTKLNESCCSRCQNRGHSVLILFKMSFF